MVSTQFLTVTTAVLLLQAVSSIDAAHPIDRSHVPDHIPKVSCEQAYNQCDFRFESFMGLPTFRIGGKPDKAFTSRIVSKVASVFLGVLNTNNIVPEFLLDDGSVAPITFFGEQKFTPTHFKPFTILDAREYAPGSGVGHETFQGNQLSVANGKCLRIYFTHYQILDPRTGDVIGNRNDVKRNENKCVVFRMTV